MTMSVVNAKRNKQKAANQMIFGIGHVSMPLSFSEMTMFQDQSISPPMNRRTNTTPMTGTEPLPTHFHLFILTFAVGAHTIGVLALDLVIVNVAVTVAAIVTSTSTSC